MQRYSIHEALGQLLVGRVVYFLRRTLLVKSNALLSSFWPPFVHTVYIWFNETAAAAAVIRTSAAHAEPRRNINEMNEKKKSACQNGWSFIIHFALSPPLTLPPPSTPAPPTHFLRAKGKLVQQSQLHFIFTCWMNNYVDYIILFYFLPPKVFSTCLLQLFVSVCVCVLAAVIHLGRDSGQEPL